MSTAGVSDKELEGEMSYALRFSLERAKPFLKTVPPVVFLGCVIWDARKYGPLGLHSLDTTFFTHARFAPRLLEHVMSSDSNHRAVQRTRDH